MDVQTTNKQLQKSLKKAVETGVVPEGRTLTVENILTLVAADLAAMSGKALADAYNIISPEKPVNRFATPEDGRKRLALKIEAKKLAANLASGETAETAKAKVTEKGKEQVKVLIASGEVMEKRLAKLNGIKTGPNVAKPKKVVLKVNRAFSGSEKITVLAASNPKREGSKAHEWFTWYKTGMTVSDYYKKGGSALHLKWDLGHHFIRVD